MGVSGSGKSVVGIALAEALGASFVEGDQLHPPRNVDLMARGIALVDDDRWGWLDTVGAAIARQFARGELVVGACSALKRSYRDRLRSLNPGLVFIHLAVDADTARLRVHGRRGHFMPASLVESQFAALERPQADEAALTLDASRPVDQLVADALRWFGRGAVTTGQR
ncbi:MAG: gluconokinase [Rhizobiaceae bacterium]